MSMRDRLRLLLARRGVVWCDDCGQGPLPRRLALRLGWLCAGIAGHYDRCRRCDRRALADPRVRNEHLVAQVLNEVYPDATRTDARVLIRVLAERGLMIAIDEGVGR